jgi:hyperosmotically inducible protein
MNTPSRLSHTLLASLLSVAVCAADNSSPAPGVGEADPNQPAAGSNPGVQPDNSGINVRDRSGATQTPQDQGTTTNPNSSDSDLEILRAVRKSIVADHSLSINGQNVKILVDNGVVTLRGPVQDGVEKARIEEITKHTPGVTKIDNRLELVPGK